jgi:hypothetical protein
MNPVLNFFLNMALVAVLVVTTLLVAEYTSRWLIPDWLRVVGLKFPHTRPDLPDSGIPNSEVPMLSMGEYDLRIRYNQHGFRDSRDVTEAGEDEIIFVGDSQIYGYGIQEEKRLSELVGDKLGVGTYNLALPADIRGYKQLLDFATRNGARAQRLVVGLSMETDIHAYPPLRPSMDAQARPADPVKIDLKARLLPLKIWLREHSALYFAVTSFVHESPVLRKFAYKAGLIVNEAPDDPDSPVVKNQAWNPQVIEQTVAALYDLCAGHDCTVAIIPSRALWSSKDPQTEARVHEAIVAKLKARGLTVVDPRARMEAGGAPLKYFFPVDQHMNPSGHSLVAELIAREMIAKSDLRKKAVNPDMSPGIANPGASAAAPAPL